jgi:outer membrane lipoprotein SlyB
MEKMNYISACALAALLLSGCTSPQGRPDYTASGALAGGATGAVVGSMTSHPGTGAAVGAAVGAVAGGIIGHGMDQEQEAQLRAQAPQTLQRIEESQPMTVADIVSMAHAGVGDDLIISQIRNSRTVYRLKTADIIELKRDGVSERVIDFMINTPREMQNYVVTGVSSAPPPALREEIVVAPGPEYVWIGGNWVWFDDRWVWHHGYWHRPHPYYGHGYYRGYYGHGYHGRW